MLCGSQGEEGDRDIGVVKSKGGCRDDNLARMCGE